MAILSKARKPDNFESHNSLKLSFTNIRKAFVRILLIVNLPFNQTLLTDILALCQTNLDDSTDSSNFYVRSYLPLSRKDSSTHMHGLAIYVKEGLPFARELALENSAGFYLCLYDWLYFTQCLISFSSIDDLLQLCARSALAVTFSYPTRNAM